MNYNKNIILYGPPGTGKTYSTAIYAVSICDGRASSESYKKVMVRYNQLKQQGQISFTTFHQSYGYEEFIEGIKPIMTDSGEIAYSVISGCFKKFCESAQERPDKNFVFVIDEINRGNISKIFGELITLIEPTKRAGQTEALTAKLPYSGDDFSVPSNVYLIGTMNSADRSIAMMDIALRRRFHLIEMMPDSSILKDVCVKGLSVARMLDLINQRIQYLYDREHQIGHAFFTHLLRPEKETLETLSEIFEHSIIPLLQEYFYEDYEKIQLILGDNNPEKSEDEKFIRDTPIDLQKTFVGSVDSLVDQREKHFEVNASAFRNINSYLKIGPNLRMEHVPQKREPESPSSDPFQSSDESDLWALKNKEAIKKQLIGMMNAWFKDSPYECLSNANRNEGCINITPRGLGASAKDRIASAWIKLHSQKIDLDISKIHAYISSEDMNRVFSAIATAPAGSKSNQWMSISELREACKVLSTLDPAHFLKK